MKAAFGCPQKSNWDFFYLYWEESTMIIQYMLDIYVSNEYLDFANEL